MPPTHDDVAPVCRVTVISEVSALKLKFDAYTLPLALTDLTLGLTIRVSRLNSLDMVT